MSIIKGIEINDKKEHKKLEIELCEIYRIMHQGHGETGILFAGHKESLFFSEKNNSMSFCDNSWFEDNFYLLSHITNKVKIVVEE